MLSSYRAKRMLCLSGLAALTAIVSLPALRGGHAETEKRVRVRGKCSSCHKESTEQWKGSPHQEAWTNPAFAKLSDNYGKKECLGCHAPDSLYTTGLGKEPAVREQFAESGVDCAACHLDADGNQHGALGLKTDDHRVIKDEKLGTVEMCASCHAKFGTVDELKATEWAKDPRACLDCHMAKEERALVDDGEKRAAHSHAFRAKSNPELLKKGLNLEASVAGDKLVVKLTSKEVGHKFPTGHDTKQAVIDVTLGDLHKTAILSKQSAQGDNRLAPGATFTLEVPTEGKKGKATVRVLHKAEPEASEEQTKVLLTAEVEVG